MPRKDDGAAVPEYDGEGSFDEANGIMVVCSGDIIEQVIHPTDNSKKIVHYNLSVPTPAPFIGFAIGPFEMIKLSPSQLQEEVMTAADLDENQQQSLMAEINMMSNIYAFALPGLEEELSVSCSFLMHVSGEANKEKERERERGRATVAHQFVYIHTHTGYAFLHTRIWFLSVFRLQACLCGRYVGRHSFQCFSGYL